MDGKDPKSIALQVAASIAQRLVSYFLLEQFFKTGKIAR